MASQFGAKAVAVVLSRVVFGVVLSGGVVRVVRSVRSGNGAAGGATLWGRYTKKKRSVLMATASASVINTLSHLFSISKNLNFAKIAEKPEPLQREGKDLGKKMGHLADVRPSQVRCGTLTGEDRG